RKGKAVCCRYFLLLALVGGADRFIAELQALRQRLQHEATRVERRVVQYAEQLPRLATAADRRSEAGHWTVTSQRKGPPRASGTHTRRVRRLSSITREPWRKVIGALGQRWHAAT